MHPWYCLADLHASKLCWKDETGILSSDCHLVELVHDARFWRNLIQPTSYYVIQEMPLLSCPRQYMNLQAQARVKELEALTGKQVSQTLHSQTVRQLESQISTLKTSMQQEEDRNKSLAQEIATLKEQAATLEAEKSKV